VTQGSFADIWTGLTPGNIAALESGSYFIGIRTSAFPGGEIRGQIAVPEPTSVVMGATAALVGLGYAWRRRRRAGA
jgi:MYXO-CTERM domain-containing protein